MSKLLPDDAIPIQCCLELAPLQPLLTSRRLQHLDLSYFPYEEQFCMFLSCYQMVVKICNLFLFQEYWNLQYCRTARIVTSFLPQTGISSLTHLL
ncbi:hypothetical protein CEXT_731541 [Caerostris extrusa]|uniref:Uncharacterized protein n=1 Tax=Caerostris extrusa TaxID=172846 RepID=A0AAV4SXH4_CAEEX|nr:hypothetical protein CEXT_731541 [Caerostris extrusa]